MCTLNNILNIRYLCLILLYSHSANAQYNNVPHKKMYIVLLAGQSNMAGRGIFRSNEDSASFDNIYSLDKDSVWKIAQNPLHWDKAEAGVGMGISFGHHLSTIMNDTVTIGLVPCAAGGTSIEQWLDNSYFGFTGNFNIYDNLISRAKKASQSGQIIGMIWHQGESNATVTKSVKYEERLHTLFKRIRKDLKIADMPIVAGELGHFLEKNKSCSYWQVINQAIYNLKKTLPNYDVVTANGLNPNPDNTHFNTQSQIVLGVRYSNTLYPLVLDFFAKHKSD